MGAAVRERAGGSRTRDGYGGGAHRFHELLRRAKDCTDSQSSIPISQSGWSCLPARPAPHLAPRAIAAASPSVPCSTAPCRATWATWLELTRDSASGSSVPAHVEGEFRRYLECGILAHGFARARCGQCRHDFLIAFSCKGRGVGPACNARRMVETAAHLAEHVMPRRRCDSGCCRCRNACATTCRATRPYQPWRCTSSWSRGGAELAPV